MRDTSFREASVLFIAVGTLGLTTMFGITCCSLGDWHSEELLLVLEAKGFDVRGYYPQPKVMLETAPPFNHCLDLELTER